MPSIIKLISNSRIELMGVGTLSVFVLHILVASDIHDYWYCGILGTIFNWVYTDGFLFLSGFSIYFSLEKDSRLFSFFKKRIKRLYLPFLVVAGPFLIILSYYYGDSIWMLILRLTTINFWIEGNFGSMWYISVTMALYLLSPLLFKLIEWEKGYLWGSLIFLGLLFLLDYVKNDLLSQEEFLHYQWITQTPAFIMGMLVAKMKSSEQSRESVFILFMIIFEPLIKIVLLGVNRFVFFPSVLYRVNTVVVFAIIFSYMKHWSSWTAIGGIINFIGVHSLELYMLHMLFHQCFVDIVKIPPFYSIFIAIAISLMICKPVKQGVEKISSLVYGGK